MENLSYALGTDFVLQGNKKYYNFRFLNKGGYGLTYLANATFYDGNIKQTGTYAIKEYYPSGIAQRNSDGSVSAISGKQQEFSESFDEFEQEGEMLQNISHPGIVPVNEVVKTNGTIYYVMSYLGGTSLVTYVKNQGGHLSEAEARRVFGGLLDAVGHLHAKQLNHLDIKPENVMMEQGPDGLLHPVLIDFGLSKHFKPNGKQTSRLGGKGVTDGYSPLEQYAGISTFSPQADIYALGATLFYMLTGNVPLKANEIDEGWIRKNIPSGVSKDLTDAICRAMERDLKTRTAMVSAFFPHGGTVRIDELKPQPNNRSGLFMKIALGVAALVIVGLLVMVLKGPDTVPTNPVDEPVATDSVAPSPGKSDVAISDEGDTELNGKEDAANSPVSVPTSNGESIENKPNNTVTNTTAVTTPETSGGTGSNISPYKEPVREPVKEPVKETVTTGTLNLGYAMYEGELKGGKPHGNGRLTFHNSHAIDSRASGKVADAGDVVTGKFKDGHLTMGTWTKTSGEQEKVMVGGI